MTSSPSLYHTRTGTFTPPQCNATPGRVLINHNVKIHKQINTKINKYIQIYMYVRTYVSQVRAYVKYVCMRVAVLKGKRLHVT